MSIVVSQRLAKVASILVATLSPWAVGVVVRQHLHPLDSAEETHRVISSIVPIFSSTQSGCVRYPRSLSTMRLEEEGVPPWKGSRQVVTRLLSLPVDLIEHLASLETRCSDHYHLERSEDSSVVEFTHHPLPCADHHPAKHPKLASFRSKYPASLLSDSAIIFASHEAALCSVEWQRCASVPEAKMRNLVETWRCWKAWTTPALVSLSLRQQVITFRDDANPSVEWKTMARDPSRSVSVPLPVDSYTSQDDHPQLEVGGDHITVLDGLTALFPSSGPGGQTANDGKVSIQQGRLEFNRSPKSSTVPVVLFGYRLRSGSETLRVTCAAAFE